MSGPYHERMQSHSSHEPPGHHGAGRSAAIVEFALKYPYFVLVAGLLTILLGGISVSVLPKDLLPAANQPAVQILGFYPGMPVENIATSLTSRFERYTGQTVGVVRQDSKSLSGVSVVRNFYNPQTDLNSAISQTTSMIMSVLRKLPPGTQPPLILPFDPMASSPLALVAVSGDMPEAKLVELARYGVRNAIQGVSGAMAPTVMGGSERQVVVYLDPVKLARFNFSPLDVLNKMMQLNSFIPTGDVKIGGVDWQIMSKGLADRIDEMNEYPLRSDNGVVVKVKEIGHVADAHKIQTNVVMVDGKRQVYVPVLRQPGANSLQVIDDVKKAMAWMQTTLSDAKLTVVADQSKMIRKAIDGIAEETAIGGGLAIAMVLLFLGDPRATVGVLLSIPLSLLFAFIGLKACGQTINAMTLGGLALSIGVLVDNSIVVLENVARKRQLGAARPRAALARRKWRCRSWPPRCARSSCCFRWFFSAAFRRCFFRRWRCR